MIQNVVTLLIFFWVSQLTAIPIAPGEGSEVRAEFRELTQRREIPLTPSPSHVGGGEPSLLSRQPETHDVGTHCQSNELLSL